MFPKKFTNLVGATDLPVHLLQLFPSSPWDKGGEVARLTLGSLSLELNEKFSVFKKYASLTPVQFNGLHEVFTEEIADWKKLWRGHREVPEILLKHGIMLYNLILLASMLNPRRDLRINMRSELNALVKIDVSRGLHRVVLPALSSKEKDLRKHDEIAIVKNIVFPGLILGDKKQEGRNELHWRDFRASSPRIELPWFSERES